MEYPNVCGSPARLALLLDATHRHLCYAKIGHFRRKKEFAAKNHNAKQNCERSTITMRRDSGVVCYTGYRAR